MINRDDHRVSVGWENVSHQVPICGSNIPEILIVSMFSEVRKATKWQPFAENI